MKKLLYCIIFSLVCSISCSVSEPTSCENVVDPFNKSSLTEALVKPRNKKNRKHKPEYSNLPQEIQSVPMNWNSLRQVARSEPADEGLILEIPYEVGVFLTDEELEVTQCGTDGSPNTKTEADSGYEEELEEMLISMARDVELLEVSGT
jgi:hypothetical protein